MKKIKKKRIIKKKIKEILYSKKLTEAFCRTEENPPRISNEAAENVIRNFK